MGALLVIGIIAGIVFGIAIAVVVIRKAVEYAVMKGLGW